MPVDKGGAGTRHYVLTLEKDLPLTFLAAFGSIYGNYRLSHMSVTAREDLPAREDLLPWDRAVMGRYNKTVDDVSDWFAVLGAMPLALGAASWYRGDACGRDLAVYSLMFAQALALQSALNLTFRSMKFWPRPYIYAERGEGRKKAESARGEAYGSFYSGHASAAFTVAVFTGEWFSEIYPNSRYKSLVWASSLTLAAAVGALRVVAGKHYPTDVVVGSLMGTGVSLGVLKLHEVCKKKISFWAIPGNIGAIFYF
jgi:membrane-associated phospholipid phosphatase